MAPIHNKDGSSSLYILPQSEGNDKYPHLVLKQNSVVARLTKGRRTVSGIYGWDEKDCIMYEFKLSDIE